MFLLLVLLLPILAEAQDDIAPGHLLFHSYGPREGFPDIPVLDVIQDRVGFVWVATEIGLFRYDGERFEAFGLNDGLNSTLISSLFEDDEGTLWVGTHSGLHRREGDRFRQVAVRDDARLLISGVADVGPEVWIISEQGLFRYGDDGVIEAVPGWPGGPATAIYSDRLRDRIWVARAAPQPEVIYWYAGSWHTTDYSAGPVPDRVNALAGDGSGRIWARQPNLVMMTEGQSDHFVRALPETLWALERTGNGGLTRGLHGDLWLPGANATMLHWQEGGWTVLDLSNSLPADWMNTALVDREGSLWIASRGLHRLLRNGLFTVYSSSEGVADALDMLRDDQSRIWVATSEGVVQLGTQGAQLVAGTEAYAVHTMALAPNGDLYLAGFPADAVLVYSPARGQVRRLEMPASARFRVRRLAVDADGTLWAATSGSGLLRARPGASSRLERVVSGDIGPGAFLTDIAIDAKRRLWVADRLGISILEQGHWQRFGIESGLRSSFVNTLQERSDGHMLASYFEPLGIASIRFSEGGFHVQAHLDPPSLAGGTNQVRMMGEDARGRLWVGTGRGVDLFDGRRWRHLGAMDGLISEDILHAFLPDPDGDVWIGTRAGLARMDAARMDALATQHAPEVTLMEVRLGNSRLDPDRIAGDAIAPTGSALDVRVAALAFAAEDLRLFRTRLVGLESEFDIGRNSHRHYPGLRHGRYRFEAAARLDESTPWGPTRSFEFDIAPAWWQLWWLRTLAACFAIGLIWFAMRWRIALLEHRNRALETGIDERTRELKVSNEALLHEVEVRAAAEAALSEINAEERRRAERMQLISRIAALISEHTERDVLLQRAADILHEVLSYPCVDIALIDAADPDTLVVGIRGGMHKALIHNTNRIPISKGIMGAAAREGQLQWVNDTRSDSRYLVPPGTAGSRAELAVPIRFGKSTLGVVSVEADTPFDYLDAASIGIIADCLAVAIENNRLFEQAQSAAVFAERRRVAHDLHDNVTQILSSISMQAQTLAHISASSGGGHTTRIEHLAELARIAVGEMRALLAELRPAESTRPQRGSRIESRLHDLQRAAFELLRHLVPDDVDVEFEFDTFVPQRQDIEEALLRILQEAVSNAVRHSGAKTLRIVVETSATHVRATVADDGRGLSMAIASSGIGMESMQARASAVGGRLQFYAPPGGGTVVQVDVPRADR